ncbi:hypothetical protein JCM19037_2801 [Geomicrobium sp. JCM 19037]|uniref:hypothetical protein n=1 Tax=Geomicrobium sp. JCM 19037 TaxID=1460634 RepID=UPI00045F3AA5|nr:hypothetical protein [Geomicrobium sp. JCM 19037]GAK04395.1 hypothetical protein JCM19037_2801 [Geomicrobium sp. JCM 19037]
MSNNNTDEKIIKKLHELNGVEDHRSKDEIYMNVKAGMKRSGKKPQPERFKKPVIIGLSSAAVLILSVVVVSQISPPGGNQEFSSDAPRESALDESDYEEDADQDQADDWEGTENNEEDQSLYVQDEDQHTETDDEDQPVVEEEELTLDEERSERIASFEYYSATIDAGERLFTLPFMAPDDQTVVNVTLQSPEIDTGQLEQVLAAFHPENYGLKESPMREFIEEGLTDEKFFEGLAEISRFETFATAEWPNQVEEVLSEISNQSTEANGYFLLPVEDQYAYLVSGNSLDLNGGVSDSLEETLKFMENDADEDRYFSIIPDEVDLESVSEAGETRVILTYDGFEDVTREEELLMFIEGVLLAAADFGYQEIEFDGAERSDFSQVGPYQLSRTLQPPAAPNYLGEVEVTN